MQVANFIKLLNSDFYTGVPDSQLKSLCDYLINEYGISNHHMIAANEGNAVALAAGYHLSTGKIPVVYLQNSGIGNIINPIASLLHPKVYGIPCIFIIGFRGEPDVPDEPQHIFQGEVTLKLLNDMDISTFIIDKDTTDENLSSFLEESTLLLKKGGSISFVVKKGALQYDIPIAYQNSNSMCREHIIEVIRAYSKEDIIVSTTGKASRELFEIREKYSEGHQCDFLTVGSMGHSSSIALTIALHKPNHKVWCIDGDGAALMHMGAFALLGTKKPKNFVHILINNEAHETVGGMPTVAGQIDFVQIAMGCGYPNAVSVSTDAELRNVLSDVQCSDTLSFIEVKASLGARANLGRPTTSAKENKEHFMNYLMSK